MSARILIVDDEPSICEILTDIVQDEGYTARAVQSGEAALEIFHQFRPDVILLDVWLGGIDGVTTLKKLKQLNPAVGVIMMSGHGTINTAVKATRDGAYDFIEKPFTMEKILLVIRNFLDMSQATRSLLKLTIACPPIIGSSAAIRQLNDTIARAAPSNGRVLIQGENGTGKELIARQIHARSKRAEQPFVAINCAAIPEELIESELFGHEKGAFTGAHQLKTGKFEHAHGGTLFLDEVGDMSLSMQAKLLRVLEERAITRVGALAVIPVDVRIIAASNKKLMELVEQGDFRQDLFYRLSVIPIEVPPLRQRTSDIPLLAEHFLVQVCAEEGIAPRTIHADALALLVGAAWPGNVRQLKNVIERMAIMAPNVVIGVTDIPTDIWQAESGTAITNMDEGDLRRAREQFEKHFIEEKLAQCDQNITRAAELMGIDRVHLHKKLKIYGIRK